MTQSNGVTRENKAVRAHRYPQRGHRVGNRVGAMAAPSGGEVVDQRPDVNL